MKNINRLSMNYIAISKRPNENGATLILALVILAAMTVFGMTSMRNVSTQQNILNNAQQHRNSQMGATNEINAQMIYMKHYSANQELLRTALELEIEEEFVLTDENNKNQTWARPMGDGIGFDKDITIKRMSDPAPGSFVGGNSFGKKGVLGSVLLEITSEYSLSHEPDATDKTPDDDGADDDGSADSDDPYDSNGTFDPEDLEALDVASASSRQIQGIQAIVPGSGY